MELCEKLVEMMENVLRCQFCGEQECILRPWLIELSSLSSLQTAPKSDGEEPKQESSSSHTYQSMKLEFSEDASLQDLYLILRALSDAGWSVSVSVQATVPSAPSLLDIHGPFTSWIRENPSIASLLFWGAAGEFSNDTTR